jgi:hypothetical protein
MNRMVLKTIGCTGGASLIMADGRDNATTTFHHEPRCVRSTWVDESQREMNENHMTDGIFFIATLAQVHGKQKTYRCILYHCMVTAPHSLRAVMSVRIAAVAVGASALNSFPHLQ